MNIRMIRNLRIDYSGPHDNIDEDKVTDFVNQINVLLSDIQEEINQQHGILVVKIYDGKRMTYSFENLSTPTIQKITQLSRP